MARTSKAFDQHVPDLHTRIPSVWGPQADKEVARIEQAYATIFGSA